MLTVLLCVTTKVEEATAEEKAGVLATHQAETKPVICSFTSLDRLLARTALLSS